MIDSERTVRFTTSTAAPIQTDEHTGRSTVPILNHKDNLNLLYDSLLPTMFA